MAMASVRLVHVAAFVATLLVAVPMVAHWYLSSSVDSVAKGASSEPTFADDALDTSFGLEFFSSAEMALLSMGPEASEAASAADLTKRVKELLRMRSSVLLELRTLESRRGEMQRQVEAFHRKIEELRVNATRQQSLLERARLSVVQAECAQREFEQRNTPEVRWPWPLTVDTGEADRADINLGAEHRCRPMESCLDLARCSLVQQTNVFVYESSMFRDRLPSGSVNIVEDPARACLLFVFVDDKVDVNKLSSLPHWGDDGRNHVMIVLSHSVKDLPTAHRAIVASSQFSHSSFRPNFDVVLPSMAVGSNDKDIWQQSPSSLLPLHRKYLISFHGSCAAAKSAVISHISRMLLDIDRDHTDDRALVDLACQPHDDTQSDECQLCADDNYRVDVLKQSTFALLPPALGTEKISSELFQVRLTEALRSGAIPVVLGRDSQSMPFSEVLNWRLAAVFVPVARLPELHFLLRTFGDRDLFVLKRQGSLIWRQYLSTAPSVVLSLTGVLRDRLLLPASAAIDTPSPSALGNAHQSVALEHLPIEMEPEEALGPLEQPRASPQFRRNYSSLMMDGYSRWNERFDPFTTFPHTPWDPVLPTDAKFFGSPGFRPIGEGVGGSGHEFSQAIGGNVASEQFTIVMLTYEREQVLIEALTRLYGLPYLNKVLVVWNSPNPPSSDLRWPDIGVPILVVRTDKNSLNNRFLPYDAIETEAVLSMDDDAHLRHDEMVFGFRVWRENRDRIVGFPGRFHAWDLEHNSWLYNSNYSCELSMVLTGAAFYHKYYNYLYSQHMPSAIRQMVDEYMNCEDLAMNFLVAHVTRKPPVKVTSRWTFRCPGCPVSLSEDDSHFQERHKCMNFFTRVFGYMPLLNTQFRADSVLFKTRIPPEKQKCFKFI